MPRQTDPENLVRSTIGREAWGRLIAWRGGTEYDVPATIDCPRGIELASRLGADAGRKLIAFAGGTRVYVAAGHAEILLSRYEEIINRHRRGETPTEIALAMTFEGRYTERTVRMVLAGRYEDFARQFGAQADLFVDQAV
jgi:hypothetical protein